MLAVGGLDLLILDAKNVLWRWRPADTKGNGTLTRVSGERLVVGWGTDIRAIGTFLRGDPESALYNLYVVDPVGEADPALLAGGRRQRLPCGADRVPRHGPDARRPRRHVHRRRRLRRGGRQAAAVPERPDRRLAGDRPGRHAPAGGADYCMVTSPSERQDRHALRVRQAERPRSSPRQGERRVQGAVPRRRWIRAGRTCAGCTWLPGANGDSDTLYWIDGQRLYASRPRGDRGAGGESGPWGVARRPAARARPPARRAGSRRRAAQSRRRPHRSLACRRWPAAGAAGSGRSGSVG